LRNFQGEDEWIKMKFRGVDAPKVAPEICVPYKESLLVLGLSLTRREKAFRIIMGICQRL